MMTLPPGSQPPIPQLRELKAAAEALVDELLQRHFESFSRSYPETTAWREAGRAGPAPTDGGRGVLNATHRPALRLVVLWEGQP
jgi:hypothetical protein